MWDVGLKSPLLFLRSIRCVNAKNRLPEKVACSIVELEKLILELLVNFTFFSTNVFPI